MKRSISIGFIIDGRWSLNCSFVLYFLCYNAFDSQSFIRQETACATVPDAVDGDISKTAAGETVEQHIQLSSFRDSGSWRLQSFEYYSDWTSKALLPDDQVSREVSTL